MRNRILLLCGCFVGLALQSRAQMAVVDPSAIAQSIVNSVNELVETSTTAENMISTFQQTIRIYEQGKAYYDHLKSVTDMVRDARRVQQSVLLLGEISDIYVRNYSRMLEDRNFSHKELSSLAYGYNAIMQKGCDAIAELKTIVNPSDLSMSDKDRLDVIGKIHGEMTHYRDLAHYYTRKAIAVSYSRSQKRNDTERVLSLYGKSHASE